MRTIEDFKNWIEREDVKEAMESFANREAIRDEILKGRLAKVSAYLKENDFDKIIERICDEHNEEYRAKCYSKGYEPYPNHKFELLYDYIRLNYAHVDNLLIPQDFLSESYFYKGYWFTTYCGQGCFYRIYDHKIKIILQT